MHESTSGSRNLDNPSLNTKPSTGNVDNNHILSPLSSFTPQDLKQYISNVERNNLNGTLTDEKEIIKDANYQNTQPSCSNHTNTNFLPSYANNESINNISNANYTDDDNESNKNSLASTLSSENSNRISIVSLNENDIDSSVIDSDEEYNNSDVIPIGNNYIVKKLIEHKNPDIKENGVIVVNQKINGLPSTICTNNSNYVNGDEIKSNKPQIGSIAVQNSTDITFGNKTFYQGPVTIKQFLVEQKNQNISNDIKENGVINLAYENDTVNDKENQIQNNQSFFGPVRLPCGKIINVNVTSVAISSIIVVILVTTIVLTVMTLGNRSSHYPGDGDDSRKNIPINSTIGHDNIADGSVLRFISRDEWIAQPPNEELENLELPAYRVIIAHTATEPCDTQAACTFRVRLIQTFHIESKHWDDIAYNFLVGGDGAVYEGRGWDKVGAHTKGYNYGSICIAFIGTFNKVVPPEKQLKVAQLLIKEGIRLGKLKPHYKLYGHRQLMASESPGVALYKIIQTWPNWSEEL